MAMSFETDTPRVEQELLEAYAAQGWLVPIAIVLSALLIVSLAWATAPKALSVGWFLMVVSVLSVRARSQQWLKQAHHMPLSRRMAISTAISSLGGLTHSYLCDPRYREDGRNRPCDAFTDLCRKLCAMGAGDVAR